MDIAQNAVEAYKQSISTAEVYTADGNMYKGLPGESYFLSFIMIFISKLQCVRLREISEKLQY